MILCGVSHVDSPAYMAHTLLQDDLQQQGTFYFNYLCAPPPVSEEEYRTKENFSFASNLKV